MAALTLVLEASTPQASVALMSDSTVVAGRVVVTHDPVTGARLEGVMPAIVACMDEAGFNPTELSSIVCSAGPGSFTSLRSAAAIAKGFCSVLDIPLYAVSSIDMLMATAQLPHGYYVPAIDAGRGEYYTQVVQVGDEGTILLTPIAILSRAALESSARERHARLVGPRLEVDVAPHASAAFAIRSSIFAAPAVSLRDWEPWYGRLAEAQVKWEAAHGRPLAV